jgi:SAM-dependent methyltransferase
MKKAIKYFLNLISVKSHIKKIKPTPILHSSIFWEKVYANGGNSGPGSYGHLAEYKRDFIEKLINDFEISSVVEFGCGDGNQLSMIKYPKYTGVDISSSTILKLKAKYRNTPNISFSLLKDYSGKEVDLTLSLDVVYHLIEDDVFYNHLENLFRNSRNLVVIYSSNFESKEWNGHVRHRRFTDWINANIFDFQLIMYEKNPYLKKINEKNATTAEFYVWQRV